MGSLGVMNFTGGNSGMGFHIPGSSFSGGLWGRQKQVIATIKPVRAQVVKKSRKPKKNCKNGKRRRKR